MSQNILIIKQPKGNQRQRQLNCTKQQKTQYESAVFPVLTKIEVCGYLGKGISLRICKNVAKGSVGSRGPLLLMDMAFKGLWRITFPRLIITPKTFNQNAYKHNNLNFAITLIQQLQGSLPLTAVSQQFMSWNESNWKVFNNETLGGIQHMVPVICI